MKWVSFLVGEYSLCHRAGINFLFKRDILSMRHFNQPPTWMGNTDFTINADVFPVTSLPRRHSASDARGGPIHFISVLHTEESTTRELWLYYKNCLHVTPLPWLCNTRHSSAAGQPNYPSPNRSWGCQLQNVLQLEENKTQLRLQSRYKLHCLQPNTQQDPGGELWRPPMKSNNSFQCLIIVVHILMTLNFNSYFHSTTI